MSLSSSWLMMLASAAVVVDISATSIFNIQHRNHMNNNNNNHMNKMQLNTDIRLMTTNKVDWDVVKRDIIDSFYTQPTYDDGTLAPIMLRLAWHSSGTFDPNVRPYGGCNGATMRFEPESDYDDNKGLEIAKNALEVVKQKHPDASYSDLWIFAGYVAVEEMKGPVIEFRPGRVDAASGDSCPPEERLPVWDEPAVELRAKFERMGLNDRDIVALSGAHSVGHTHEDHSGFPYHQWDNTPTVFDNTYFDFLLANWWVFDDDDKTRPYYRNRSWLMLLSDFLLREDTEFRKIVEEYSTDELRWHMDFAIAFKKVTENGVGSF